MHWNLEEIKDLLVENGYSIMANHLVEDEELICDPLIWTKIDVIGAIENEIEDLTAEELDDHFEDIMGNLNVDPLTDAQSGNEYLSEEVCNHFKK
jgi:hypothetical protein